LTGINSHYFVVFFGVGIGFATIRCHYYQIAMVLKWLALCLFAYVITAFVVKPDWGAVIHDTFLPSWPKGHQAWQTLVAILGTTISPYLFFWQSSQEVEEEKAMGRRMRVQREKVTKREIIDRILDVGTGTFFSNFVMYFIILTAALALHGHGVTNIETSKTSGRSIKAISWSTGLFPLHSWLNRRWFTRRPDANWFGGLRFRRNIWLARRPRSIVPWRTLLL
jgi:Mn2+/Fe2+ NRAMP family transporter